MTDQATAKPNRRPKRNAMTPTGPEQAKAPKTTSAPPRETKIAQVVRLLQRAEGTNLDQIVKTTGWLPHTARAALTGLKKKGHVIVREKTSEVAIYRIAVGAGQ